MEEEKIQDAKVEGGEVVQSQQSLNVATDLQNKKLKKKGMFITGLVFFALVVVMFITVCCYKGFIVDWAHSSDSPEQALAIAVLLIVLLTIFPVFLLPMLIFFVTSVVLLALSRKSVSKKIRVASEVCMWIDVAIFVTMVILLVVWIVA